MAAVHVTAAAADRRQRRPLIALLGSALAVVMLLLGYQIWSSYHEALREAETKTYNYASIIEARLDATLRRIDAVLLAVAQEITPAALDQRAVARHAIEVNAALNRELVNFAEVGGLRVFDAHGDLLYMSSAEGTPRANVADRDYYRRLRDDPQAGLVFSEVVTSASSGRRTVVAARALRDSQATFRGVVLALIELEQFKRLFQTLDIGAAGVVVIRRSDDFAGVVRWPELEREINRPLPPGNPVREAMRAGKPFGTLKFPASSDGVVRTYSYRSVAGYPFFVLVALACDDALAGWQARSAAVGGSGLLLVLLLAGLLAHLWRIEESEVRALTALKSSEERLRLALAASQQGLYDLNVQSGEALVNDEYALMLGHDPAQFHESNAAWIERLHPDDRDRVARVYADYIAGRVPEYRVEFRQRTRDGQYKWILSIGKVVERDAHGAPLRMLGVHRNISERKQAEHALKNLNVELESRVAQRTAELESARDEAERANRAKSEFLSSMSHELRTPMHAILGFGQLLESDTARLPETARRYVHEILRAGEHLLELIDDLLDLARIEAGKHEIHLEPVPVPVLIDESLGLVEPAAHARGITLSFTAPVSPDCIVMADRMRLKQVLLNLLSNAIKYNREGGSVQLECTAEREALRISVTDSGPGLSPEQQAQLFTPFERLGASKSTIKGAGIGLVLTKQLIAMMHGEVGLHSEPGVGSTFWVQLPRAATAASPAGRADAAAQVVSSRSSREDRQTVLYIEDDPVNVMLMEALFATQPGLRLVTAQTAAQGLEIARDLRPEVILLDIQLPDADGYEVLRRLRAAEPTREIPVLAVSANAMPGDIERGLASGFADYLTKPLDFARLLAAVQRALQALSLR